LRKEGRHSVEGLEYVASWVDVDFAICWQLMKTDDRGLLEAWCEAGRELVDFEIVPVRTSAEAAEVMASRHP
jgi:hypothetical protein